MTTDNKITPENDFTVEGLRLKFDLPAPEALSDDNPVRVQAQYNLRTPGGAPQDGFRLNIDPDDKNQIIKTLRLDGRELVSGVDFEVRTENGQRFIVFLTPINDNAEISCDVELRTHQNTSGEGLYLSEHPDTKAKTYLTQNEEFGFRKIIPFPDRPSVAIQSIRTEVTGPTDALPELLSNGDLKDDHTENGRRRVVWEIDRPMPSYLFALVAGKFDKETDIYKTLDGSKEISLEAYADPGNGPRAKVALAALKKAMRFD